MQQRRIWGPSYVGLCELWQRGLSDPQMGVLLKCFQSVGPNIGNY